jgi:hypothetical protein
MSATSQLSGSEGEAGPRMGQRRTGRGLPAFLGAYVVVYAVAEISLGDENSRTLLREIGYGTLAILALMLMLRASWRAADHATQSAWRWIAASMVCTIVAFAVITWYDVTNRVTPFPSAIDVCYLLSYPAFVVGLLRFPTSAQSGASRTRLLVDAATIAVGAASVVWFLVIGPTLADDHQPLFNGIVASAYPVGDVVQLFAAPTSSCERPPRVRVGRSGS